jgi:hypothetical protein
MKNPRICIFVVLTALVFSAVGCTSSGIDYALVCEIDMEGYTFKIEGEEGPVSIQTQGESTQSKYDPNGALSSVEVEVNRVLTFEESGNAYTLVGKISVDFQSNSVNYKVTATGDTLEEPQICTE